MRRLIRQSLRTGGDPVIRPVRARKQVPRKLVVLCDVSGSMDSYARALLLFLHAAVGSGPGVEVFAFGTRLTRLTAELGTRDPAAALERCREATHDWGSGTRIGVVARGVQRRLRQARALARRGRADRLRRLGARRQRARRRARWRGSRAPPTRVVWVNPLKGDPRYQPLAGGMRAALPYVDRFISGTTCAASRRSPRCSPGSSAATRRAGSGRQLTPGTSSVAVPAPFDVEEIRSARDRRQVVRDLRARGGGLGRREPRHRASRSPRGRSGTRPSSHLLFSDMPGDVRRRYTPGSGVVEVLRPARKCNGMTYDADLNLLVCEHVTSQLVRERRDGSREILAYHHEGKYLNSPNDVITTLGRHDLLLRPVVRPHARLRHRARARARLPGRLPDPARAAARTS